MSGIRGIITAGLNDRNRLSLAPCLLFFSGTFLGFRRTAEFCKREETEVSRFRGFREIGKGACIRRNAFNTLYTRCCLTDIRFRLTGADGR